MGQKYYAVQRGRNTGVFSSWNETSAAVSGYSGAVYKSFNNFSDAKNFASSSGGYSTGPTRPSDSSKSSGSRAYGYSPHNGLIISNGPVKYPSRSATASQSAGSSGPYARRISSSGSQRSSGAVSGNSAGSGSSQVVYTDGSSRGNGKAGAQAGWGVYYGDEDARNMSARLSGDRQTNQRAELTAINYALDNHLNDILSGKTHDLVVRTDSNYSKKCLTEWADRWEKNGYVSSKGTAVENSDLVKAGREKMARIAELGSNVFLEHVRAHRGDKGNEAADRLANAGALS